jgi:hypothetical protein
MEELLEESRRKEMKRKEIKIEELTQIKINNNT